MFLEYEHEEWAQSKRNSTGNSSVLREKKQIKRIMSVKVRRLLNIISSKLSNFANEVAKIQRIKG